jgi:hypothetical protein
MMLRLAFALTLMPAIAFAASDVPIGIGGAIRHQQATAQEACGQPNPPASCPASATPTQPAPADPLVKTAPREQ